MADVPERLGEYRLVKLVAQGGMGEVFLAVEERDGQTPRIVALKRLLPAIAAHPEAARLFLNEARVLALLRHRNIVQILELGEADRQFYIAMEYVAGMSLGQLREELAKAGRRFPAQHAVEIVAQVAEALFHAHNVRDKAARPLQLVHRDISPRNILVSTKGEVKLIDFGIAKPTAIEKATTAIRPRGKLPYMSPEQILAKPLDGRSDLFSLSIVLAELVAGRHPFGPHGRDQGERIRNAAPLPLAEVDPALAPLDTFLKRALEKEPGRRFQNGLSFADHLRTAGKALPPAEILLSTLVSQHADEELEGISRSIDSVSDGYRLQRVAQISDMSLLLAQELERNTGIRKAVARPAPAVVDPLKNTDPSNDATVQDMPAVPRPPGRNVPARKR